MIELNRRSGGACDTLQLYIEKLFNLPNPQVINLPPQIDEIMNKTNLEPAQHSRA